MAKRIKKMSVEQFEEVMKREWKPVELVGSAIPDYLKGIPEDVLHSVVVSGTNISGLEYSDKLIPSGQLIGGIDVYRNAPDAPVELNKDWYAVVKVPESDTMLMISGPIEDDDHWLDELPERLQNIEVLGVPKISEE